MREASFKPISDRSTIIHDNFDDRRLFGIHRSAQGHANFRGVIDTCTVTAKRYSDIGKVRVHMIHANITPGIEPGLRCFCFGIALVPGDNRDYRDAMLYTCRKVAKCSHELPIA